MANRPDANPDAVGQDLLQKLDPASQRALLEAYRRQEAARGERSPARRWAVAINRAVYRMSRSWFTWFMVITGTWVVLPWLAPVFMSLGWVGPARAIYTFYSFQCHQLPQRSYFLFGPEPMISLGQLRTIWQNTANPVILRQFVGNPEVGYKVAWSDRMVSAYGSIPLSALLLWPFRRRLRPLPWWGFALFALPMAVDGITHFISDLSGIDQGFRYTNAWLAELTGSALPAAFYAGNALGSFNSWMRLITGVLFGFGLMAFVMPHLDAAFQDSARQVEAKFERARVEL